MMFFITVLVYGNASYLHSSVTFNMGFNVKIIYLVLVIF